MSKQFKNENCASCSIERAVTGDHIFAREFFLKTARANLPQAPICNKCNNEKSKLEHYLTTVLPFGGRHPDALENLSMLVPKRLRKNAKLHRQLSDAQSAVEIPLDVSQLERLFCFIARELEWYHRRIYLDDHRHTVFAMVIRSRFQAVDDPEFRIKGRNRVAESVGNGTFQYEGLEATDDPTLTVWRFSVLGGLVMGDGDLYKQLPTEIVAFTGPKQSVEQLAGLAKQRILSFVEEK